MRPFNIATIKLNRRRFFFSIATGVAIACSIFFLWTPTVVYVLSEAVRNQKSIDSADWLADMGPKAKRAIPALLSVTNEDDWIAQSAAVALWKIDRQTNVLIDVFSNRMAKAYVSQRLDIFRYFARLGGDLKPATSIIEKELFDVAVRADAVNYFEKYEPERLIVVENAVNGSPGFFLNRHIIALESTNCREHYPDLQAIAILGPPATNAVPALKKALVQFKSPDGSGDLLWIIRAITEIGPGAAAITPDLTNILFKTIALQNPRFEPSVTRRICAAIGSIGPAASNAIPALKYCFTNTNAVRARLSAAIALSQVDPNDPVAIAALRYFETNGGPGLLDRSDAQPWKIDHRFFVLNNLSQSPLEAQIRARVRLCQLGLAREWPIPALIAEADHIGIWAIDVLGEIGPPARDALPALRRELAWRNASPIQATIAIRKIDPEAARQLRLPGLLIAGQDPY